MRLGNIMPILDMAHLIIRCPRTGMNVPIWLAKKASTDQADAFEAVTCPACLRLHFINKAGKLLGEKEEVERATKESLYPATSAASTAANRRSTRSAVKEYP